MKEHRSNILLTAVLAAAVLAFIFKGELLAPDMGEALAAPAGLEVRAVPVPLNETDPAQRQVGALRYVAGWALTSGHDRFGGLSGLVVEPGGSLVAISDQGDWFTAVFDPASKQPVVDAHLYPFAQDMPEDTKEDFDAESIIRTADGGYLVSFEQEHRLELAAPGQEAAPWPQSALMDFSGVADNGGMEAISWTADGRLLAFSERGVDVQGRSRGWLVGEDTSDFIYFTPPRNYAPTDAALMPNGDILVLTRFFSKLDGVAAKLLRIRAADIQPGATLVGEELATLAPPLTVDNMEGLDVGVAPDGTLLVYMISDDNFSGSQRTLLLMFALQD